MDAKKEVQRKRYTLKHKAHVVRLIQKYRDGGMLIDEACETNGIKRSQFYQWKKYIKAKKKQPEEYLRLMHRKSDYAGMKSELADNEQDILRFIFQKRELGMNVTTRIIINYIKSIDAKFRQKTESAQWAQIHRFLKAHEFQLRIQKNGTENGKIQGANVEDEKDQKDDGDKEEDCDSEDEMRYLDGLAHGGENKPPERSDDGDVSQAGQTISEINGKLNHEIEVGKNDFGSPVEECDSSNSKEAIVAKRGTDNGKRASSNSSLNKISSVTKSRHKTNPNKNMKRRALLEEVRVHTELLLKFEGIIPKKEFKKRKRDLYLALPPLPLPAKERMASRMAKDASSAGPAASKKRGTKSHQVTEQKVSARGKSRRREQGHRRYPQRKQKKCERSC